MDKGNFAISNDNGIVTVDDSVLNESNFAEQIEQMLPKRFSSILDFMQEILRCPDIETAKKKNRSFRYFVEKYGL